MEKICKNCFYAECEGSFLYRCKRFPLSVVVTELHHCGEFKPRLLCENSIPVLCGSRVPVPKF
jgi:hypothetical protein